MAAEDEEELRSRLEKAEALVAETRTQAERWVAESQAFMDEKIAEAREQAAAASQELDEVKAELTRERELRRDLERGPRETVAEPEQPVPDPSVPPSQAPPPVAEPSAGEGCSVCHRAAEGRDAAQLVSEGWAAVDDERLCPSCRDAGWQLAPGVDSPFRRYSDRRPSGQSDPGEEPARTASNHTSER